MVTEGTIDPFMPSFHTSFTCPALVTDASLDRQTIINLKPCFMKKTITIIGKAAAVVLVAAIYFHFNVGTEVTGFFRTVATKIVPWANQVIYS